MQLLILHGSGQAAIANYIHGVKKEFRGLVEEIDGRQLSFDQALINLSNMSLFTERRVVILENFDDNIDLSRVPASDDLTVIIRFGKLLNPKSLVLKKATGVGVKVIVYAEKDKAQIFPFLDNIAERNKTALLQLDPLLDEFGGQYVLAMIFFMLRRIANPPKHTPFIAKKIAGQRKKINDAQICKLYRQAILTDFEIKNGWLSERLGLTLFVSSIISSE